jgi:hypothetical protein
MNEMTDEEKLVMDKLVDFWNAFVQLSESPKVNDQIQVMDAVHAIQGVLAMRVARRANPEIWSQ